MNPFHPTVINVPDPDSALFAMLGHLLQHGLKSDSRNGPVLRARTPVVSVMANPLSRISTSVARDANPYFHFLEAMWMLAGRNDVAYPKFIAANIKEFSDDDTTLNGAYGYRWRNHFDYDQIDTAIECLKADPTTRRVVISMWDGFEDLRAPGQPTSKDLPCNGSIQLDVVDGRLNMAVINRSNDCVWGLYGANAVHMSILHEFIAHQTDIPLGTMYTWSMNAHIYTEYPVVKRCLDSIQDGTFLEGHMIPTRDVDVGLFAFNKSRVTREQFNAALWEPRADFKGDLQTQVSDNGLWASTAYALQESYWAFRRSGAAKGHDALLQWKPLCHPGWFAACEAWMSRRRLAAAEASNRTAIPTQTGPGEVIIAEIATTAPASPTPVIWTPNGTGT